LTPVHLNKINCEEEEKWGGIVWKQGSPDYCAEGWQLSTSEVKLRVATGFVGV